jgi:hypothetical protein
MAPGQVVIHIGAVTGYALGRREHGDNGARARARHGVHEGSADAAQPRRAFKHNIMKGIYVDTHPEREHACDENQDAVPQRHSSATVRSGGWVEEGSSQQQDKGADAYKKDARKRGKNHTGACAADVRAGDWRPTGAAAAARGGRAGCAVADSLSLPQRGKRGRGGEFSTIY